MLGWTEILVVVSIGVIVFSAKKWPSLGRALRDSVLGFKKGISGKTDERTVRDVTPGSGTNQSKRSTDSHTSSKS